MKKSFSVILLSLYVLQASAQKPKDLSLLDFTENTQVFLKGISTTPMSMYNLTDMLSCGIDNAGTLTYDFYVPKHIELLSFKDKVAGYAFKIEDFKSQEKILSYLTKRFPKLALIDSSRWGKIYKYADSKMILELQTIGIDDFKAQRRANVSVKTVALAQAIAEQEKKYERKPNNK